MHTLSKIEQDKATLGASLALPEKYAAQGSSRVLLVWLEHKLVKMQSDVKARIKALNEAEATNGRK